MLIAELLQIRFPLSPVTVLQTFLELHLEQHRPLHIDNFQLADVTSTKVAALLTSDLVRVIMCPGYVVAQLVEALRYKAESGVPRRGGLTPPVRKALQNRAKLNPIVKN